MRFSKDILHVGVLATTDDAGGKTRSLIRQITPAALRHWARVFREMRSAGTAFDVFHGRHRDQGADYLRRRTDKPHPAAVGELLDVAVAPDGQSLRLLVELHDPAAIEAASDNADQLSVVLFDHVQAPDGREWKDALIGADLVFRSADKTQGPFVRVPFPEGDFTVTPHFRQLVTTVRGYGLDISPDTTPETLPAELARATAALAAKAKRRRRVNAAGVHYDAHAGTLAPVDPEANAEVEVTQPGLVAMGLGCGPAKRCRCEQAAARRFVDRQAARMPGEYGPRR